MRRPLFRITSAAAAAAVVIAAVPVVDGATRLDPSFGGTGTVTTAAGAGRSQAFDAVLVGDDLVAVGEASNGADKDLAVVRYKPDGSLDPGFGTGGVVLVAGPQAGPDAAHAVTELGGSLVVAGQAWNGDDWDLAVVKLGPDGALDPSFDSDGIVTTDVSGRDDIAFAVATAPDGGIVVAGRTSEGSDGDDIVVAKYKPDGSLDDTFDTSGIAREDVDGDDDEARAVAVEASGNVLVAGVATTDDGDDDAAVARFLPDGELDSTFGTGGIALVDAGGNDAANGLALEGGRILLAGTTDRGTQAMLLLAALDSDGALDPTFGDAGISAHSVNGRDDAAEDVAVLPDGRIVTTGRTYNGRDDDVLTTVHLSDGTLDPVASAAVLKVGTRDDAGRAVEVHPDGRFSVAGVGHVDGVRRFVAARYLGATVANVSLTADGPTTTRRGVKLTATFEAANAGPDPTGPTTITVAAPPGSVADAVLSASDGGTCDSSSCTWPALGPGGKITVSLTATPALVGSLELIASVAAAGDQSVGDDAANVTVNVPDQPPSSSEVTPSPQPLPSPSEVNARFTCPKGAGAASPFGDVAASSTHRIAISCLKRRGLVSGVSSDSYEPAGSVTRAEAASPLAELLTLAGLDMDTTRDWFHDDDGNLNEASINGLASHGVLAGVGGGRVNPDAPLTRAHLASLLIRTGQAAGDPGAPDPRDAFGDDNGSPHEPAINLAASLGYMTGVAPGRFDPDRPVRRDEFASSVARLLERLERLGLVDPSA